MIPLIITSIEDDDDRRFMEDLYLSYNRLMFSTISKIISDEWAVEDILQTVLEKLIGKLQLLRTFSKPKLINYISKTSRNTTLNYLRSQSRRSNEISYDDEIEDASLTSPGVEDLLLMSEMIGNAHAAFEKLDDRNKRLLELKYFLEKTNEEIADELRVKPSSVRMMLTRARKALLAEIEKLG